MKQYGRVVSTEIRFSLPQSRTKSFVSSRHQIDSFRFF